MPVEYPTTSQFYPSHFLRGGTRWKNTLFVAELRKGTKHEGFHIFIHSTPECDRFCSHEYKTMVVLLKINTKYTECSLTLEKLCVVGTKQTNAFVVIISVNNACP
jgi:hypothetical protein